MTEKAYCPYCGKQFPEKKDIFGESVHILNRCCFCNRSPIWDKTGKFLGKIKK